MKETWLLKQMLDSLRKLIHQPFTEGLYCATLGTVEMNDMVPIFEAYGV